MKSHRKHKPFLPSEPEPILRKGRKGGRVSPDGKKRRLDALKAAELEFWFWFNLNEREKASRATCPYRDQEHQVYARNGRVVARCYHGGDGVFLQSAQERYEKLWTQAKNDGLV